ncbi:PucR family transcriptional regulator ligand-binding domain-containing protein [Hominifimenecus sp. rT4P-3]|uniref:PucR family transcriptional regulator n=1 Tax=Hominifimenecus sp. rT4P-3 TaxID=3242979 RepID=UPI003DA4F566
MLKVVDLLKMPSLGQSYIVAGHNGMFNVVKKLEIMEEPYPGVLEFLVPYGFMLTNFWSMKDDKEGRLKLVRSMIEKRCAGIGIMPGPHLDDVIDPEIIELANQNGFPIIYVSSSVRWGNVISEYGVLTHSNIMSSLDAQLGEILNSFSDFHSEKNVGHFCREMEKLLGLPMIMSTDTVYSGDSGQINIALVISKIQAVCQESRTTLVSPISIRLDDEYLIIVYFGKRSMVATYVSNSAWNQPALQIFHKIAPAVTKELDRMCAVPFYKKNSQMIANLGETQVFLALVKRENIQNVVKELDYHYLIYEQNTFFNYCILLIPHEFKKINEIYPEYQKIIQTLSPDFFVFSSVPMDKKELQKEVEPLKYMVNTLSYLDGIYSLDELPLLYILSYAPFEHKSRLFLNMKELDVKEEKAFLDTLRLYTVIRNMSDVAGLLGLHTNSVKYRLGKALKQLGYNEENVLGDMYRIKLLIQLELIALES